MDQRLRSQLLVWRDGHLQSRHAFGYADYLDWNEYCAGVRADHDGRQVLRHLCLYHLRLVAAIALCHDIQSAQYQGFALVACVRSTTTATGRVCQIRYGTGVGQVHVGIRLQHTHLETLRNDAVAYSDAYDMYRVAA